MGGVSEIKKRLLQLSLDSRALHSAVELDNLPLLDALLMSGVSVNKKDGLGRTALHVATAKTFSIAARKLLQAGANSNISDLLGRTALHIAVKIRSSEIVNILLDCTELDVNKQDGKGRTAICGAAKRGSVDIVRRLLSANANVDLADANGFTPLCYAGKNEHAAVVDVLLRAGADKKPGRSLLSGSLHDALEGGRHEAVRVLLEAGANPNAAHESRSNKSPLHTASESDYADTVALLIAAGADVNGVDYWKDSPLHVALRNDCFEIARLLIRSGADFSMLNYQDETPISIAIERCLVPVVKEMLKQATSGSKATLGKERTTGGHPHAAQLRQKDLDNALIKIISDKRWEDHGSLVTTLLLLGADTAVKDQYGKNAIHIAICEKKIDIARTLLSNGADPNSKSDILDRSPVHWVAMFGGNSSRALIETLTQHEADVKAVDAWGNTALHEATRWANILAVEALLNAGISVDARNSQGETPLHTLCRIQLKPGDPEGIYTSILDALMRAPGGDLESRSDDGKIPLHVAAGHTRLDQRILIKLLVEYGSNINARDQAGNTPLEYAAQRGVPSNATTLLDMKLTQGTLTKESLGRLFQLAEANPRFSEEDRWKFHLMAEEI